MGPRSLPEASRGCPVSHWHGQCQQPRQSGCESKEHPPDCPSFPRCMGPPRGCCGVKRQADHTDASSFPDSLLKNVQNRQNVLYINKEGEPGSLLAQAQAAWSLGLIQTGVSVAPAPQLPEGPWALSMECALPCTLPLHLARCGGEPVACFRNRRCGRVFLPRSALPSLSLPESAEWCLLAC